MNAGFQNEKELIHDFIKLLNVSSHDKNCVLFDLILYVPLTIFQLCQDRSYWVEPVLSKDICVLLKDTTQ